MLTFEQEKTLESEAIAGGSFNGSCTKLGIDLSDTETKKEARAIWDKFFGSGKTRVRT